MPVKNLFWKFIPPYEVKVVLESIDELLGKYAKICRPVLEPEIIALAKDAEQTVYSIRIEHVDPDHLAFIINTNVIGRHIGSREYHMYRGMLNQIGNDMKSLWLNLQNEMLEQGHITQKAVKEDNTWLEEQERNAG